MRLFHVDLIELLFLLVVVTLVKSDDSGVPCGECVDNACCVNNTCECDPGYTGDPGFFCHRNETHISSSGSKDPLQETFRGEHFVYHLIGSTRLVQLTTSRDTGGYCNFYLWGWTERDKGKFFFAGLAFRLDQINSAQSINSSNRGYIHALGRAGEPYWWNVKLYADGIHDEETFSTTSGTYQVKHYQGCEFRFETLPSNFMKVSISCCGITYAIRPFHQDHPNRTSGWWNSIERDNNPTFMNWVRGSEPLTLEYEGHVTVQNMLDYTGITSRREAGTYIAITNTAFARYPGAPESLGLLKSMLKDCPIGKRNDLFAKIQCLFDNPRMINCLNRNDEKSVATTVTALHYGISYLCYNVIDSCLPLAHILQNPGCAGIVSEFPNLVALADESNCPEGVMVNDFRLDDI